MLKKSETPSTETSPVIKKPKAKKIKKILVNFFSIFFIFISILAVFLFFFVFAPGKKLYDQILFAKSDAKALQESISQKNINQVKIDLDQVKNRLYLIENKYQKLSFIGSFPYIKNFYQDGKIAINIAKEAIETGKILITAIEPYQDFLGLQGTATDSEETAQDRITFLTESIESIIPHLDTIEIKINNIDKYLNQINPSRYPEEIRSIPIRSNILKAKEMVAEIHKLVRDGQPILKQTPWLLGKDQERTYLMIFQNNAELRPTGGFWTAYGIIKVKDGKITPGISDDIYSLDAKLNSRIPAPRPIKEYHIDVPYFHLRDMNISPDFPTSAQIFLENYRKVVGKNAQVDGVIALDTQVLVDIVEVLGKVGVSGYGNFTAEPDKRCDGCPQIIYQLQWISTRPRDYIEVNRKGFLGPLMNSLLSNAMSSEKEKIPLLMQKLFDNLNQKHIMFYFPQEELQQAAELANLAGKINETDTNTDYLHLSDANMSSAKTNIFLFQKIKHEINSKNNKVEHKITVTYINPSRASNCNLEKGDLCLNAPKYRNWFRFFVPTGSELIKMTGSEVEPVLYEELGKQVFEGFYGDKFPLFAKSSLRTSIEYISSVPPSSNYSILLQKQAGTKPVEYELIVNGKTYDKFSWIADKTIRLPL